MAITPEQALGSKREIEAAKIDELEAKCDEELKQKWDDRGTVSIDTDKYNLFVINEVQRRFQASGWKVTYFDGRDGSGLNFTTKALDPEGFYDR